MYDFGRKVFMNFSRNRRLQKSNMGKRNGDSGRATVIGYGLLTLAIFWSAALVPSIGGAVTPGFWIAPSLLTLFVLIIGVVLLRPDKERDY